MRFCLSLFLILGFFQVNGQGFQGIPLDLKIQIEKSHVNKDLVALGTYFVGRPYSYMALSKANPEKVYFSFQDFDCVTFIENVLALYLSNGDDMAFKRHLIAFRYFSSDDIRYETRMHYLSSAFEKWQQMGIIIRLKGPKEQLLKKDIHYLSSYLTGKNMAVDLNQIKITERAISKKPISFIDRRHVSQVLPRLKSGDLVAFLSKRSDLDFKHVGFITMKDGKAHLLHASQEKKVICISDEDLATYILKHPTMIGIQVFRPN